MTPSWKLSKLKNILLQSNKLRRLKRCSSIFRSFIIQLFCFIQVLMGMLLPSNIGIYILPSMSYVVHLSWFWCLWRALSAHHDIVMMMMIQIRARMVKRVASNTRKEEEEEEEEEKGGQEWHSFTKERIRTDMHWRRRWCMCVCVYVCECMRVWVWMKSSS